MCTEGVRWRRFRPRLLGWLLCLAPREPQNLEPLEPLEPLLEYRSRCKNAPKPFGFTKLVYSTSQRPAYQRAPGSRPVRRGYPIAATM